MVGLISVVLIIVAAFAVDLGMQRVVRSDMQALADVVALDAARLLDGRTAKQIRDGDARHESLADAVTDSAALNDDSLGDVVSVEATLVALTSDSLGAQVAITDSSGEPVSVADDVVPDAVVVRAAGEVEFAFATGSGAAVRHSLANATTFACFRVGSFAAALDSGSASVAGVFEAIVKDSLGLNLSAIGYRGLLTTSVEVADLAAQLGAGSVEELAELGSLRVDGLLSAYATVLGNDGNTAARTEVLKMAQNVTSTLAVDLGGLLSVGSGSVLDGRLNVVDLLGSLTLGVASSVSNGNNFLDTGVAWATPHVSHGDVELRAIEAPRQACGIVGTQAHTAQVSFAANLSFNLPNKLNLGSAGSLSVGTPADPTSKAGTIHLDASLARATGTLRSATCGSNTLADPDGIHVAVDTGTITANVNLPFRLRGTLNTTGSTSIVPAGVLSTLVSSLFGVVSSVTKVELVLDLRANNTASLTTPASVATSPTSYWAPPRTYTDVQPTGAGGPVAVPTPSVAIDLTQSTASAKITVRTLGLLTETRVATVSLPSLDLTSIVGAATSSVIGSSSASVVANINEAIVPVSTLLGIRTGAADLLGVAAPECGHPSLIG